MLTIKIIFTITSLEKKEKKLFIQNTIYNSCNNNNNNNNNNNTLYYINTNEIPAELSFENLISSHVKISPLLWLHDKSCPSHQKTIKVKWFGISSVFI